MKVCQMNQINTSYTSRDSKTFFPVEEKASESVFDSIPQAGAFVLAENILQRKEWTHRTAFPVLVVLTVALIGYLFFRHVHKLCKDIFQKQTFRPKGRCIVLGAQMAPKRAEKLVKPYIENVVWRKPEPWPTQYYIENITRRKPEPWPEQYPCKVFE